MAFLDRIGDAIKTGGATDRPDPVPSLPGRLGRIDDRGGMITAAPPGFMQPYIGAIGEFRTPASDEHTLGIVVEALFDRVVDADRVDRCAAGLHLTLTPVDPRLVIHKQPGQMEAGFPPGEPEVIGGH